MFSRRRHLQLRANHNHDIGIISQIVGVWTDCIFRSLLYDNDVLIVAVF